MGNNPRLIHDTAYALALHLLRVFEPLLREEEKRDAFTECYEAAKAGIEAFCIQADREAVRLCRPSKN
jgi:hypothetical protein